MEVGCLCWLPTWNASKGKTSCTQGASDENGRRGIKLTRATAEELAALIEKRRQVSSVIIWTCVSLTSFQGAYPLWPSGAGAQCCDHCCTHGATVGPFHACIPGCEFSCMRCTPTLRGRWPAGKAEEHPGCGGLCEGV